MLLLYKKAIDIDNRDKSLGVWKAISNIGVNCPNPVLVILDTLNCCMSGDENKTVDNTSFVKVAKEIMQEFDCTVMIVHQTGQYSDNKGRVRGFSVFKATTEFQKLLVFEMI